MEKKFEQKNNNGALFKNGKKEKETHADYRGTALIDNKEYYVNAWLKESKNGNKFFSLSFNQKEGLTVKSKETNDLPF